MSNLDSSNPELIGRQIGSYRLVRRLGVGGMGAVYLGEHLSIRHRAAIKVLHPLFANQPEVVARFFNEACAVNVVSHPSLLDIYDYGQAEGIGAYLVMEYLEGESLEAYLAREKKMPLALAVQVIGRIASPLSAAHAQGIIHRDLKPANVFLLPDPDHPGELRIKLLDFGIAKLNAASGIAANKTKTGMLLGTPLYMSPEQCLGEAIDRRTDIYALGVIAYELLCGRPPFSSGGFATILADHVETPPPPLRRWSPALPTEVEAAVLMALAKSPDERFAAAIAFGNALAAAAGAASRHPRVPAEAPRQLPKTAFAPTAPALTPSPGAAARGAERSMRSAPARPDPTGPGAPPAWRGPGSHGSEGPESARRRVPPTTQNRPLPGRRGVPPTAEQQAVGRAKLVVRVRPDEELKAPRRVGRWVFGLLLVASTAGAASYLQLAPKSPWRPFSTRQAATLQSGSVGTKPQASRGGGAVGLQPTGLQRTGLQRTAVGLQRQQRTADGAAAGASAPPAGDRPDSGAQPRGPASPEKPMAQTGGPETKVAAVRAAGQTKPGKGQTGAGQTKPDAGNTPAPTPGAPQQKSATGPDGGKKTPAPLGPAPLGAAPAPTGPTTAAPRPQPKARARTLLERVPEPLAHAYRNRNHRSFFKLAARYLKRHPKDRDALTLVGMNACRVKQVHLADQIFNKLRGYHQRVLARSCKRAGVPMGQ